MYAVFRGRLRHCQLLAKISCNHLLIYVYLIDKISGPIALRCHVFQSDDHEFRVFHKDFFDKCQKYKHPYRKYTHHVQIYLHSEGDEMVHKLVLTVCFYMSRHRRADFSNFCSVGLKTVLDSSKGNHIRLLYSTVTCCWYDGQEMNVQRSDCILLVQSRA